MMGFAKYAEDNYEIWEERMTNSRKYSSYNQFEEPVSSVRKKRVPAVSSGSMRSSTSSQTKFSGRLNYFSSRY